MISIFNHLFVVYCIDKFENNPRILLKVSLNFLYVINDLKVILLLVHGKSFQSFLKIIKLIKVTTYIDQSERKRES